jgi:acetylornithine/succinyldiaminopimelate/putrescine aminotransferase
VTLESRPCIVRAQNDLLFDEDGHRAIDLFSAHGTAWFGHANRGVTAYVETQLRKAWITGGLETPVFARARAAIEHLFPSSHGLAALYSTGMEATEFALRLARVSTGKSGALGFERSMHGKSLATAYLAWDNHDGVTLPGFERLPFLPQYGEAEILSRLQRALAAGGVGAVFIEPLQGCGGGHSASADFYRATARLCAQAGVLLVFDELLTGLHRTRPLFYHTPLGFVPDVVLIGKGLGNGFPVSAVVAHRRLTIERAMLPGSTFAGNPLACAAVVGSLEQARALDLPARVAAIERTITHRLADVSAQGVCLRGRGALWVLELPAGVNASAVAVELYRKGVAIGHAGRHLRLLPAATIAPEHLNIACSLIRDVLWRACHAEQRDEAGEAAVCAVERLQ